MNLTFNDLRAANIKRLPQFRTKQGALAHSQPDGSDWSLGEWICALAGEVGELANLIKKIKRGDLSLDDPNTREEVAAELADVAVYLDITAFRCGVDLGRAVVDKFNHISRRVHSDIFLADNIDYKIVRVSAKEDRSISDVLIAPGIQDVTTAQIMCSALNEASDQVHEASCRSLAASDVSFEDRNPYLFVVKRYDYKLYRAPTKP